MELEVLYYGFLKFFEIFSCYQQFQTIMTHKHWKGKVYYILNSSLHYTYLYGTPVISLVIFFQMVKFSVAYRVFLLLH